MSALIPSSRQETSVLTNSRRDPLDFKLSVLFYSDFRSDHEASDTLRVSIIPQRGGVIEHSAISRNGRQIAFSAVDVGKPPLGLRSTDSLESNALPDMEEGTYLYWSPDCCSLAFLARTVLMRTEVFG